MVAIVTMMTGMAELAEGWDQLPKAGSQGDDLLVTYQAYWRKTVVRFHETPKKSIGNSKPGINVVWGSGRGCEACAGWSLGVIKSGWREVDESIVSGELSQSM